ncbi:MAG: zonular occludens toxin domain-containing protein [Peptostreptococcaceae bacterium]|nr:zonular occludens toxin domain-containing protein [Peptostreptococcaceae bacterium]
MIYLYSGTPGSGKSYHATKDIYIKLKQNERKKKKFTHRVISNYGLDVKTDNFILLDNSEITTEYLYDFARKNHMQRVEGQTLLVIDEAQILFNSRDWNSGTKQKEKEKRDTRMDWIKFFSQHRKFGYNVILIAQNDRMLDRQVRALVEYEIAHMKMNNFFLVLPFTVFLAVTRWYGQKMKLDHEMILYRKKIANLYDSYGFFENEQTEQTEQKTKTEILPDPMLEETIETVASGTDAEGCVLAMGFPSTEPKSDRTEQLLETLYQ